MWFRLTNFCGKAVEREREPPAGGSADLVSEYPGSEHEGQNFASRHVHIYTSTH